MNFTSTISQSKICGVYRILNALNNKSYIGSSKTVEYRCYEHRKNLLKNKHCNQHLQNAWNKYGMNNFTFELIEECAEDELIEKEQKLIDESRSAKRSYGYNICEVADKPAMTQEVRDKISKSLQGNVPWNVGVPHSEEAKEKMRQRKIGICGKDHARFGKTHTEKTKEKIRQKGLLWLENNDHSFLGKTHTEETKNKIRNANKQHLIELTKSQSKPVKQVKDGKVIAVFPSVSKAKEQTGISHIGSCANGKRKTAGNFTWKFD